MRARNPSLHTKYSFLKILTGSDLSRRRLPLMMVSSRNPGPVLWITGCMHGDEVGGVVVIQEIFKKIRRRLVKGSIYAFPLMNPIGFESISRNIPLSREDLNRSFPGNRNGSLAERIANTIFSTIRQTRPTLVLDLHNDWRSSIPYILLDSDSSKFPSDTYRKTVAFAWKVGLLVVRDPERIESTLSFSLLKEGIPTLTLELGESYVVNEANILFGVNAVWNLLMDMGMVDRLEEEFKYPLVGEFSRKDLKYVSSPLSSTSGIIRFKVSPGSIVRKGQPLAKIYNPFGKRQETIICPNEGIVLGVSDSSVAFPGAPIMCFGVKE